MSYGQLARPIEWFFRGEERARAVTALRSYCKGQLAAPKEGPLFSGSAFERFLDPGHPNRFMPSDLVAVTMLSVGVPPHGAIWMLGAGQQKLSQLLEEVGPDRPIWEAADEELDVVPQPIASGVTFIATGSETSQRASCWPPSVPRSSRSGTRTSLQR